MLIARMQGIWDFLYFIGFKKMSIYFYFSSTYFLGCRIRIWNPFLGSASKN